MKCNYCDVSMERQDDYVTDGTGKIINKNAMYRCPDCGREWRWELHIPGLVCLFNPDEDGPPEAAWQEEERNDAL